MYKIQAAAQGLQSTGIYGHDKDEIKVKIKELRIKYPKARIVLVTIPPNPLSRGHGGTGWGAYADKIYRAYQMIETLTPLVKGYEKTRAEAEKKMAAELLELRTVQQAWQRWVAEAYQQLGEQAPAEILNPGQPAATNPEAVQQALEEKLLDVLAQFYSDVVAKARYETTKDAKKHTLVREARNKVLEITRDENWHPVI